jgi:hypothetical protein
MEAKRELDRRFDRFIADYMAAAPKLHRFDLVRYLDKARTEIELAQHWLDKLHATLANASAVVREADLKPGHT